MSQFQKSKQFVRSLPLNDRARGLDINQLFLRELEYFLSLDSVPGFDDKRREFVEALIFTDRPYSNEGEIKWENFKSELGAIWLLGAKLGLRINGFERESRRTHKGGKKCDISAMIAGEELFFEVKAKCAEAKQAPPKALRDLLAKCDYQATPTIRSKNYSPAELEEDAARISDHIRRFQDAVASGQSQRHESPEPYSSKSVEVLFGSEPGQPGHLFSPDSIEDICSYLLGTDGTAEEENQKVPKVKEADMEKGADYLVCRVPGWDNWPTLVNHCFGKTTQLSVKGFVSRDPRLGGLKGVVLFTDQHDNFCVVYSDAGTNRLLV